MQHPAYPTVIQNPGDLAYAWRLPRKIKSTVVFRHATLHSRVKIIISTSMILKIPKEGKRLRGYCGWGGEKGCVRSLVLDCDFS